MKGFISPEYNHIFNPKNGFFARWGKTKDEDPEYCPYGAEILDIEVTTICNGVRDLSGKRKLCPYCYKNNSPIGINMSFETFKNVFDKINKGKVLTQIAFGADSQAKTNPDLWKMMEYCRNNGIVPNITVADIDDATAENLVDCCGAVAVSYVIRKKKILLERNNENWIVCSEDEIQDLDSCDYKEIEVDDTNKNVCYDSIKNLTDRGMKQVNIHCCVSAESYDKIMELFKDYKTDRRLEKLNAIVLLSLKRKGRGINYTPLPFEKFKALVDYAFENKIPLGFDSCSCGKFQKCLDDNQRKKFDILSEPCESSLYSSFVSVDGEFFPCSFMHGAEGWEKGIDVVNCNDFVKDVWFNERTVAWRKRLLENKRNCPVYEI